jgi:chemotaxis protein methyltransferase CheR
MNEHLPEPLLARTSEFITAKMALYFPKDQWCYLERKMLSAAKEFGFTDGEAFINWLFTTSLTREQMEVLVSHLTVTETYFWREPRVFEALEEHLLPELVHYQEKEDKRLRIWSAGCASGEEPYSLAIAIHRALPDLKDWNITIMATDIDTKNLRKAMAGKYTNWSFRNTPPWLKEEYFTCPEKGYFEIRPDIRKMVSFAYLNLGEDNYPSSLNNTNAMDIIFCRNVLMYFTQEQAKLVGQSLGRSLLKGGWMVVSSSELSQHLFSQFTSVQFPGAIVYRNDLSETKLYEDFISDKYLPQVIPAPVSLDFTSVVSFEHDLQNPLYGKSDELPTIEQSKPRRIEQTNNATIISKDPGVKETENERGPTPKAIIDIVQELANQGRLVDAQTLCEKAISADRLNPGLYYLYATILQEQKKENDAFLSLKRALYLDPDYVLAYFTMGNLAMHRGEMQVAKKCFENVLGLLSTYKPEAVLPEFDGLTAGRFREIVIATIQAGALA